MKKLLLTLSIIFIVSVFVGCDIFFSEPITCMEGAEDETIYYIDWNDQTAVEGTACMVASTDNAEYLVMKDDISDISETELSGMTEDFESTIYPTVTSKFGDIHHDYDDNSKVRVVLYDINLDLMEGYVKTDDMSPILETGRNNGEYLFLDSKLSSDQLKFTLAHELQHVVNQSNMINNTGSADALSDAWLDEALAMTAEHVVYGKDNDSVTRRIEKFNSDTNASIRNGEKALLVWDDSAENYALSYLFMQYFLNDVGENQIQTLIGRPEGNINALPPVAGGETVESLIKGWAIANMTNTDYDGRLDTDVTVNMPSNPLSSIKPGAVMYDTYNSCSDGTCGTPTEPDIRYVFIDDNGTPADYTSATKSIVCNVQAFTGDPASATAQNIGDWYVLNKSRVDTKALEKQYTAEELRYMNSYSPVYRR